MGSERNRACLGFQQPRQAADAFADVVLTVVREAQAYEIAEFTGAGEQLGSGSVSRKPCRR